MNTTLEFIYNLNQVDEIATKLYNLGSSCNVYTFTGNLGAGKTTLIKSLFKKFSIDEPIVSPTFNYVTSYKNSNRETLYHFDLYRINNLQDFMNAGFDEYLYNDKSWAFIEWPEIIMPLFTKNVCHITIEYMSETSRKLNYHIM